MDLSAKSVREHTVVVQTAGVDSEAEALEKRLRRVQIIARSLQGKIAMSRWFMGVASGRCRSLTLPTSAVNSTGTRFTLICASGCGSHAVLVAPGKTPPEAPYFIASIWSWLSTHTWAGRGIKLASARRCAFVSSGAIAHSRKLRNAAAVSGLGCFSDTTAYS